MEERTMLFVSGYEKVEGVQSVMEAGKQLLAGEKEGWEVFQRWSETS